MIHSNRPGTRSNQTRAATLSSSMGTPTEPERGAALKLVRQIDNHPARPSFEWLAEVDALFSRRPDNFNRTITPPEKKLLEATLERGLGVQRKKPPAKKKAEPTTAKKSAPQKRAAAKRTPRRREKGPL